MVPISSSLRSALVTWATEMESLMAGSDDRGWTGPPEGELERLNQRGSALAVQVRAELDATWTVTYLDAFTGERNVVPPPRPFHRRHHRS